MLAKSIGDVAGKSIERSGMHVYPKDRVVSEFMGSRQAGEIFHNILVAWRGFHGRDFMAVDVKGNALMERIQDIGHKSVKTLQSDRPSAGLVAQEAAVLGLRDRLRAKFYHFCQPCPSNATECVAVAEGEPSIHDQHPEGGRPSAICGCHGRSHFVRIEDFKRLVKANDHGLFDEVTPKTNPRWGELLHTDDEPPPSGNNKMIKFVSTCTNYFKQDGERSTTSNFVRCWEVKPEFLSQTGSRRSGKKRTRAPEE